MHKSVLLEESIKYLNVVSSGIYVDATLGYAGHSSEILKRIKSGFLFAFDQDEDARCFSNSKLGKISDRYEIIPTNFVNMKRELSERNIHEVDGVLFDLGVSSPQLDQADRGFSYKMNAKLDMRMDMSSPFSAYDVVNNYSYEELVNIFYKYGEESYAKPIAKKIVSVRENKKIETTLELVDIIKSVYPAKKMRDKHPAKKVFQAIRIEVNKEFDVFEKALEDSISMLKVGGRICVITFHSLEDKICKNIFNKYTKIDDNLKHLPIIPDDKLPKYRIVANNIKPTEEELSLNPRSRSAKLRVIERIKG